MITPKVKSLTVGTSHPSNDRVPGDAANVLPPLAPTQRDALRPPVQLGNPAIALASRPSDVLGRGE